MKKLVLFLCALLFALDASAAPVTRPVKSFGGTSFINGVVPQASDFNGDPDTLYAEFNGNIDNANIKAGAGILLSKIDTTAGFTVNVRTVNAAPCKILDESDQGADLRRWAICSVAGQFRLGTYTDADVLQNNWLTITRADGSFNLGGTSGTNVINGTTTFNQTVIFAGGGSPGAPPGAVSMYIGNSAPTGWLLLDGTTNSCTGTSSANALLCTQLISQVATINYKGAAAAVITSDFTSDEILHSAHGRTAGDRIHFSTTTTLPAPLSSATVYCVISTTTDRYKVGTVCGGSVLNITDNGTGTHSDYFNFIVPDMRGRGPRGTGQAATVETITSVTAAGNAVAVGSNDSKWITGMPVTVTNASTFTGLVNGSYWLVRASSTTIQIASSLANAQNGTVITVTGTGNATFTYTGTSRTLGQFGGEEVHAESSTEQLAHVHTQTYVISIGSGGSQGSGSANQASLGSATASTGGNAAMNILTPYFIINYIIKL